MHNKQNNHLLCLLMVAERIPDYLCPSLIVLLDSGQTQVKINNGSPLPTPPPHTIGDQPAW